MSAGEAINASSFDSQTFTVVPFSKLNAKVSLTGTVKASMLTCEKVAQVGSVHHTLLRGPTVVHLTAAAISEKDEMVPVHLFAFSRWSPESRAGVECDAPTRADIAAKPMKEVKE